MSDGHDIGAVAAWALGACPDDEAAELEAHLASCTSCRAEAARLRDAAGWLAGAQAAAPPDRLRESVLAAAGRRRRPSVTAVAQLARPYASQVAALDGLLSELTAQDWDALAAPHRTVRRTIAHLAENDAMVAGDLGLAQVVAPVPEVRRTWREQAEAVLNRVSAAEATMLDRPVRLAGRRPIRRPLRDALVQRAFETWVHADDVRAAVHRSPVPLSPEQVQMIVSLGVRLLPAALQAMGLARPGRTAWLILSGPGRGEWLLPLAPGTPAGAADLTIGAEAVEFCQLMAGRRSVDAFEHTVDRDPAVAIDVLRAASTLACE
jgi:uncharacterized protein (TIGR03083 family)